LFNLFELYDDARNYQRQMQAVCLQNTSIGHHCYIESPGTASLQSQIVEYCVI